MSNAAADILHQAAELNAGDPQRTGNIVYFNDDCDVVLAGDIHGNRTGMAKIISYADLARPDRRLVLQEVIHGPLDPKTQHDRSVELLVRAARLKIAHPQQVVFLMGNHDVAQITGNEILKEGRGYCRSFTAGVEYAYGGEAGEVLRAITDFLMSMPMLVRCPNKVLLTHSLPSPNRMDVAGREVFDRPYTDADLHRGGGVYEWTWGRNPTDEQVEALATELGVELFILGHRHTPTGCEQVASRAVTLASNHEHGCIIHFPCSRPVTAETLQQYVKTIASLGA